ncbi:phosphonate C-P lyase system protein PhnH [Ruminococcus sp.]|uniref:phosphonate C-P lyase system protein PhnH n=1 Tax=Ruminococcus sp. TaxID=41978 RepID=UPI0025EB5D10|nr:phosphonate C-P lyase system protein PhnH [Ruminococcus sp.]
MKTLHQFDEVFDTQAVFRKLLEGMSNPGRTVSIALQTNKMFGEHSAFLALGMTLLDNEVSFSVCGNETLREELQLVTLSEEKNICEADYIFVTSAQTFSAILAQAKCGTLVDPHHSATLIIRDNGEPKQTILLYGPGIDGTMEFVCSEMMQQAIALRDRQEYEYPMGVDLIFVTDNGNVTCIPRLVKRRETAWHM